MVPVMTSDQHPSKMQRASGREAAFSRLGNGRTLRAWAVSTQERKKPTWARATADPENSLVWGNPSATGARGLL